ncbi:hypothetical protein AGLY_000582 [Aphis glycines]|uniref:Uncharacterized protein n=1 Tax=Aphis glycines TaxID=307491 RepID=A0A6G0U8V4_APHGL|nr:hypothetical protein AGLY_000582 [Aphis glycines]
MFILSQAIIPVFVFAVMVNFYHFDSIFSTEVFVNFTNCNDCTNSTCYNNNSGPCGVLSDNITVQCYTCSEEDGNQQYYTEEDCKANCSDVTKCYCDGMCYKCVEDNSTNTSQFTCNITLSQCPDDFQNSTQDESIEPHSTTPFPPTPVTPAFPRTPVTPAAPATPPAPPPPDEPPPDKPPSRRRGSLSLNRLNTSLV